MSPAGISTLRTAPAALRHRRDVRLLTSVQKAMLRDALSQSQALKDDRGYQYWAGVHGLPVPEWCQHGSHLFLPWHRAYLYLFEKSLQDLVPGVTLPWWDWTSDHAKGIPAAYSSSTVRDKPNPLYDSPIQKIGRRKANEPRTWRDPGANGQLPTTTELSAVLSNTDFFTFQTQLESIHGSVHVWTGGTMGAIPVAAYDPIFWAHHCMIDRAWYLWELQHPGAGPPRSMLDQALAPFPLTVRDTLSTNHLGYAYAASTAAAEGPGRHG